MKPLEYYITVNVKMPTRDEFTDVFVYSRGKVVFQGPFLEYKPQAEGNFKGMLVEKFLNEEGFKNQRIAYGAEEARLRAEFKADLFEEYGVTRNPKSELAYSMAMDHYNGYGCKLQDAVDHFEQLVPLFKD
jgi:hypothetical protein